MLSMSAPLFALTSSRGALLALGHSIPMGHCYLPVVFLLQVSRPLLQ